MPTVRWQGTAPPRAIATALRDNGFRIHHDEADSTTPAVVATSASRRLPRNLPVAGWIWLCKEPVSDPMAVDAVLHGAYAAISLRSRDASSDLVARLKELCTALPELPAASGLVMKSAAAQRAAAQAARVAPTSMSVLLTGETGTGKEIVARQIHAWSLRAAKRFVPINCAAIPNELMEAELFGYARGAFSGAVQRYDGQVMAAEGGTVFLDEIDDTPFETQVKLLRVLEDRVVSRLGENVWREVDFRLLAATNRDLRALVDAGMFGADLYERLAIVSIHLVPLRERLEDLPLLAAHFIRRFATDQHQSAPADIRREALRALAAYPWPGNIRELRNVIFETLVYKRSGTEILLSDLPKRILRRNADDDTASAVDRRTLAQKIERGTMSLRDEVAALERVAIDEALKRSGGNAAQAARLLGQLGRGAARDPGGTLRAMMRRLGKS